MMIINTQGIVLRASKYKENDLILTVFTRKLGKVSVLAKGAKRNKSSLLATSQPLSYSNYTLRKYGTMYKVSQTDIIKSFYNISYNIEAFSYATYITKLVEDSIFENQTNNRLFILLAQTLYLYSTLDVDYKYITRAFELKFLEYIGYKPIVNRCTNCKTANLQNGMFNIYEGGVLCSNCQNKFEENLKIDQTTIKLMEYILNNDILTCNKAKVSKYITNELEKILRMYMQNYLDNLNLKSLYLLQNMDNI